MLEDEDVLMYCDGYISRDYIYIDKAYKLSRYCLNSTFKDKLKKMWIGI